MEEQQPAFPAHHASWNQYLAPAAAPPTTGQPPSFTCMDCGHIGAAQITIKEGANRGRPFFSCREGCGAFIGFVDQQAPSKEKRQNKVQKKREPAAAVQLPLPSDGKKARVALDAPVVQWLQFLGEIRPHVSDPIKAKIDMKVVELINSEI